MYFFPIIIIFIVVAQAAQAAFPGDGNHEWMAPNFAAGDVRGPCPLINTLANHGYINRNGKNISTNELAEATEDVFGVAQDTIWFLVNLTSQLEGLPVTAVGGGDDNDGQDYDVLFHLNDLYVLDHPGSMLQLDPSISDDPQSGKSNGCLVDSLLEATSQPSTSSNSGPTGSVTLKSIQSFSQKRINDWILSLDDDDGVDARKDILTEPLLNQLTFEIVGMMVLTNEIVANDTLSTSVNATILEEWIRHNRLLQDYTYPPREGLQYFHPALNATDDSFRLFDVTGPFVAQVFENVTTIPTAAEGKKERMCEPDVEYASDELDSVDVVDSGKDDKNNTKNTESGGSNIGHHGYSVTTIIVLWLLFLLLVDDTTTIMVTML